jgi:cytochrome c peroxidase
VAQPANPAPVIAETASPEPASTPQRNVEESQAVVLLRGLFKVPTLRNIALTVPCMHDGRFNTLEEVLDHYNDGIKKSSTLSPLIMEADNLGKLSDQRISLNLTEGERIAIIAFLQTLTDEEFVTTEKFSNPFMAES